MNEQVNTFGVEALLRLPSESTRMDITLAQGYKYLAFIMCDFVITAANFLDCWTALT